MAYRLALFDFDGVLADSAGWFSAQLPDLASRHGFVAPDAKGLERLRRLPSRQILKEFKVSPLRLPAIAADLRRRMAADAASIRLFAGVPDLMSDLRDAGVRLAVVSSNSEANVRAVLGAQAGLISAYSCGAALFGKSTRFRHLLGRYELDADQACVVGDEVRDIEAAHKAGLPAAAVGWGYGAPEALAAAVPDFLARSPEELRQFLTR
ncbi:HAD hydrolase-like protein [Brevundimonas sp. GCM10030266]|uniref:HAD hydrolase-like protein n=1 Tax=Brevundimonas sp. GCM10030266 TaxID=3273386 RepID=UPI003606BDAB